MATNTSRLNVEVQAKDHASHVIKGLQSTIIRFVGAVSAALSTFSAVVLPARQATEFDFALANVAKTTGFAEAEMRSLSDAITEMSTTIAVTQTGLANIAAIAGQLGLGNEGVRAVEAFTESVARASVTLGLAEEEVANFGAQVLNVFKIDTTNIENVFSLVNELSNNSVADGRALLDIMLRVGNIAGLTAVQVAALAASSKDFGVQTEVAGTTLVRSFANMQGKAEDFAELMETSVAEWSAAVETDAVAAFKSVLEQLNQLDAASRVNIIKKLFGEGRQLATITKFVSDAANGFDVLNGHLDRANTAYEEGTSSLEEYERVAESFKVQFDLLGNAVRNLAIQFGDVLLDAVAETVTKLQEFFNSTDAEQFIQAAAEEVAYFVTILGDFVQWLIETRTRWSALIDVLQILVGLKIGQVIANILSGLKAKAATLSQVGTAWNNATVQANAYTAAATKAAAATAAAAASASQVAAASAASFGGATAAAVGVSGVRQGTRAVADYNSELSKSLKLQQQRIEVERETASRLKAYQAQELAGLQKGTAEYYKKNKAIYALRYAQAQRVVDAVKGEKAIQAAMNANAAAYVSSTTAMASVSTATTKLGKVFTRFGSLVKGIFSGIGGFLRTNWLTIAASLFFIADDLADLWEYAFGPTEAEREVQRLIEQQRKNAEDKVREEVNAFKSFLQKTAQEQKADVFGVTLYESSVVDEFDRVKQAIVELDNLLKAGQGGREVQIRVQANIESYDQQIKAAYDAIEDLKRQNEELAETQDLYRGGVPIYEEVATKIDLNNARVRALTREIENLRDAQQESKDTYDQLTKSIADNARRTKQEIEAIILGAAEPFYVWLEQFAKIRKSEEDLNQLREDRARINAQLAEATEQGQEASVLLSLTNAVEALDQAIEDAEVNLESFVADVRELESKVNIADKFRVDFVSKSDAASVDAINRSALKLQKTGNTVIRTFRQSRAAMEDYIVATTRSIAENKKLQASFNAYRAPIDDFIASMQGFYDNIGKVVDAAKDSVAEFNAEIENTLALRDTELAEEKELNDVRKETSKSIDDIRDKYKKQIANARALGRTGLADRYIKERDAAIEAAREVGKLAEARIKADSTIAKATIVEDEALKAAEEFKQKLREIKEAEKAGAYDSGQAKAGERESDLQDLSRLWEAAQAKLQDYKDSARDLARDRSVDATGKPLISKEDVKAYLDRVGRVEIALANIAKSGETAVTSSLKSLGEELDKIGDGYADAIRKGNAELAKLTEFTPQLKEVAKALEKAWTDAFETIGGTYESIKQQFDEQQNVKIAVEDGLTQGEAERLLGRFDGFGNEAQAKFADGFQEGLTEKITGILGGLDVDATEGEPKVTVPVGPDLKEFNANVQKQLEIYQQNNPDGVKVAVGVQPDALESSANDALEQASLEGEVKVTKLDVNGATVEGQVKSPIRIEGKAQGGYIRGPGTGTSDSILARLSNGEFVMDAFTTRFFGPRFFSALQSYAKAGVKSIRMPAIDFPRFATGGAVATGSTLGEVVTLNLNIGGQTYTLGGQRDQVRGLLSAMKSVSR